MNGLTKLMKMETKLFLREPAGLGFGLAVPLIVLVALGSIPSFRVTKPELDGTSIIGLYVPILIGLSLATQALNMLPVVMAQYRERGILRRMSATPIQPSRLLAAQAVVQAGVFLTMVVLLVTIGRLAFGVPLPANPAGFVLVLLLATAACFSIGTLLAAVLPNNRIAGPVTMLIYFPMLFFAGLWIPREAMPHLLNGIGDFIPLGATVQALRDTSAGHWPQLVNVGALLVITVLASAAATKLFRWR